MTLDGLLPRLVHAVERLGLPGPSRSERRAWVGDGRAHIEVHTGGEPGSEALGGGLERELAALPGVSWAQMNGTLGRLVVDYDQGELSTDDLIDSIATVEHAFEAHREPFPNDRPEHPADPEPFERDVAELGGDLVGLVSHLVRRGATRRPPLLDQTASALALLDAVPVLRRGLERLFGTHTTDVGLALAGAVLHGLSGRATALLVDVALRWALASETVAARRVWEAREPDLCGEPTGAPMPPLERVPRPVPLPSGPVERYSNGAALLAVVAFWGTLLMGRTTRDAADVLLTGMPKAATVGRQVFAARLTRILAGRGTVPLDTGTLRRLDRVDTVVLDAAAMLSGRWELGEVAPFGAPDADDLGVLAAGMLDVDRPDAVQERGGWRLAPLRRDLPLPRGGPSRVRRLRRGGAMPLALTRAGRLVALVQARRALDPLARELAAAARRGGNLLVVAGTDGTVARRLDADQTVPGGSGLTGSIRRLQRAGRVVTLVATDKRAALRAADVGVGVLTPETPVPWGAHLLCGPGLATACVLAEATATSRQVSRRGARLALYGSLFGALMAVAGPPGGAVRRALTTVDGAALVSIAAGAWSGASVARRRPSPPEDTTPWHGLPAEAVLRRLGTSGDGLGAEEAARRHGADEPGPTAQPAPTNLAKATVEELNNPLTPVLGAGAGLSLAGGSPTDAVLLGVVAFLDALIDGVQRVGTDRALRRLIDASAARVRLRRDGTEVEATADELVPGDIVLLEAGDVVPADCRIVEAAALEVDESSLTGESALAEKQVAPTSAAAVADRRSMLFEGTVVAAGEAVAVVVATGGATEVGRSTAAARAGAATTAGVEARLQALTRVTIPIAIGAGAVLVAAAGFRGRPVRATIGTAISLTVAAVPEGLPVVATLAQVSAARRLSRRNLLVRNMRTVEALGRVDVLCFDKTGTLTEGRLRLRRVSDGATNDAADELTGARREVLETALRASPDARNGTRLPHPTDQAVVSGAERAAVGIGDWETVAELPFEPARGFHAVLGRTGEAHRLVVKGAPEIVLPRCTTWRGPRGRRPLDDAARRVIAAELELLTGRGDRVLAVAERAASGRADLQEDRVERLELRGLIGLADPVRPAAAAAVAGLRRAGVQVIMLTGDHPGTAEAIGGELGLLNDHPVITGPVLDALSDRDLDDVLPRVTLFARVSPEHKVRVVHALRRAGRVTAMTGDGANDAPAIRLADVGVALGKRGTNAAKEAADLVVTDDQVETIISAIIEGRAIWASVRDAIAILVGGNLGEIAFTLLTGAIGGDSALNARQLILVNLLTDLAPSTVLAMRPPHRLSSEDLLHEGPEASLGATLYRQVAARAATTSAAAGAAWALAGRGGPSPRRQTIGLVALVGAQLGQTALDSDGDPVVLAASLLSTGALAGVVQTPGLSRFFGCRPLGPLGWATGLGAAALATAASTAASRRSPAPPSVA
jgi:cation-transporting ATPase I